MSSTDHWLITCHSLITFIHSSIEHMSFTHPTITCHPLITYRSVIICHEIRAWQQMQGQVGLIGLLFERCLQRGCNHGRCMKSKSTTTFDRVTVPEAMVGPHESWSDWGFDSNSWIKGKTMTLVNHLKWNQQKSLS